ncbi:MAG: RsmE family RNA methyltransferase [Kofleriaceae bacterium]
MRIFVAPSALVEGELAIRGDEHHYLARVRRAAVGDTIELFDGEGRRARAQIRAMTDAVTTVSVEVVATITPSRPHVRVLLPLIKGDRMDFALEKLVEVGVDEIVVWPAARSVVKLEADRREARIEKYALALQAASRQSDRPQVPVITWADSLVAATANVVGARFVLDPGTETRLEEVEDNVSEVTFVGGPEGGLDPVELSHLVAAGFEPIGLGPRVLRAETAPVVAVAIVRALTRS